MTISSVKHRISFLDDCLFLFTAYCLFLLNYSSAARIGCTLIGDYGSLLLTRFDTQIPYIPAWSVIYNLFYLIPIGTYILIRKTKIDDPVFVYRILFIGFMTLFLGPLIFIIFPVSISNLVHFPSTLYFSSNSIVQANELFIYHVSSSVEHFGSFPSLHVAIAWICLVISLKEFTLFKNKYALFTFRLLTILLYSAVIISTMLLKLHFIIDVISGILFAQLLLYLFYLRRDVVTDQYISNYIIPNRYKLLPFINLMLISVFIICRWVTSPC